MSEDQETPVIGMIATGLSGTINLGAIAREAAATHLSPGCMALLWT